MENINFYNWVLDKTKRTKRIIIISSSMLILISNLISFLNDMGKINISLEIIPEWFTFELLIYVLQLVLVGYFCFLIGNHLVADRLHEIEKKMNEWTTNETIKKLGLTQERFKIILGSAINNQFWFRVLIIFFLLTIGVLYIGQIIHYFSKVDLFEISIEKKSSLKALSFYFIIIASILSAWILWMLYLILTYLTGGNEIKFNKILFVSIGLFVFAVYALICYHYCLNELKIISTYNLIFIGLISAVFFGLFASKLDGGIGETSAWVLLAFFTLSSIQPFVHLFHKDNHGALFVILLWVSLNLKIIVFAFITYLIKNDKVLTFTIFNSIFSEKYQSLKVEFENELIKIKQEKTERNK